MHSKYFYMSKERSCAKLLSCTSINNPRENVQVRDCCSDWKQGLTW